MDNILQDLSPSALIRAIDANSIESIKSWTQWSRMELRQEPGITWTAADIPFFLFNVVLGLVSQTGNARTGPGPVIADVLARARSRQVPMAWWVGPNDPTPDLGRHLAEQGWFHAATLTGMALDLQSPGQPPAPPPGLSISRVGSAEALESWCRIMTSVSEFPDFAGEAWWEMYRDLGMIDHPQWRLYLGTLNGTPVTTSSLFLGAGVAGIHGVTTLEEHRGRGFATAMTYPPLADALDQGYRVGALFSSEMAVNVYRKIGFQEHCQGNIYVWMPEDDSA